MFRRSAVIKASILGNHVSLIKITSSQNRYCSSKAPQDDINISFSLKEMFKRVEDTHKEDIRSLRKNIKASQESIRVELNAKHGSEFRAMLMHMKIIIGIGLLKGVYEDPIKISYTLKEMFKRMENSHMKMLKGNTKISQEATKAELRAESRALRLHIRCVIAICSLGVGVLIKAYMSFLKEMEKINGKKQKCSFLWHYW